MGPDDAADVAKALAAFGAPSIRYHSFGQGQVKPSSVVLPRPDLAPLDPAASAAGPRPAVPPDPVLSALPTPRPAGPVLRPVATPPIASPPAPPWLMAQLAAVPPLDAASLDAPMPPMPAFRRTLDLAAPHHSMLSRAVPSRDPPPLDPPAGPSAAIALTLRALLETDLTVGDGAPRIAGRTLPTAFAGMRLSAPHISIQTNATSKPAALPLPGRSALAGRHGQSLPAMFAFLASDPTPGETSLLP